MYFGLTKAFLKGLLILNIFSLLTNSSISSDLENDLCLSLSEHQCFSFFLKGKTKTETSVVFFIFSQFRERSPTFQGYPWVVVGSYSFFQLQDVETRTLNHTSGVSFYCLQSLFPQEPQAKFKLLQSPQSLLRECFPPSADSVMTNVTHGAGVRLYNLGKQTS